MDDVARNSHHGDPRRVLGAQAEATAERIAPGPIALAQRAADDGHGQRLVVVRRLESAAGHDRQAQRFEVTRRDGTIIDDGRVAAIERMTV